MNNMRQIDAQRKAFDCFEALRFMRYFEASRRLMLELFRIYEIEDVLAFVYIIENTQKSRNAVDVDLEILPKGPRDLYTNDFYLDFQYNPRRLLQSSDAHDKYRPWPVRTAERTHSICPLTQAISAMSDPSMFDKLPLCARLVLNNAATPTYGRFLAGLESHFLPDALRAKRAENLDLRRGRGISTNLSLVERLSIFLKSLSGVRLDWLGDPRNLNFVPYARPRNLSVTHEPLFWSPQSHMCQPYYSGYLVCAHVHGKSMRFYNRYGELMPWQRSNIERSLPTTMGVAIFQCIMLSSRGDLLRSWRAPVNIQRGDRLTFIVTDVYQYGDTICLDKPYSQRFKLIDQLCTDIQLPDIFAPTEAITDRSEAMTLLTTNSKDYYEGIEGLYFRDLNATVAFKSVDFAQTRRPSVAFDRIDFRLIDIENLIYDQARVVLDILVPPLAFESCMIVSVYAHDAENYYVTRYSVECASLVHWFTFARRFDDRREPRYHDSRNVFVANYKRKPRGIFYLRLYYEEVDDVIKVVGYDQKITDSKFDSF